MINFDKKIRDLPPELQQEVVDFIEFLQAKHQKKRVQKKFKQPTGESVYDLMKNLGVIGCIEGPGDLSHNKAYLEGYGQ